MLVKYVLNTSHNSVSYVIFLLPSLRMTFSPLDSLFVKRGTTVGFQFNLVEKDFCNMLVFVSDFPGNINCKNFPFDFLLHLY